MYVAEDLETQKIVGYVLGKLDSAKESELKQKKAHITSLAVDYKYRCNILFSFNFLDVWELLLI